jgi:hypothetical protein
MLQVYLLTDLEKLERFISSKFRIMRSFPRSYLITVFVYLYVNLYIYIYKNDMQPRKRAVVVKDHPLSEVLPTT